ncbi:MAG: diguanylate cyclase [Acidimicrobiaceae bacterium]|jgi:diguanylate cyclase (GGDEF)-like protein
MVGTQRNVRRVTPGEWTEALQRLLHDGNVPLAVALTDLDGFAGINEKHGAEAGDRVLEAWEKTLGGSVPAEAIVARLGGDEYSVALPGSSPENALILLEEVRSHFNAHGVKGLDEEVDASVGIAAAPPHGSTGEELYRAAGEALMRAKREGRGRVAIYVEAKMTLKSNYYSRANLDRLSKLSGATSRTEASLLREALDDLFEKYRNDL